MNQDVRTEIVRAFTATSNRATLSLVDEISRKLSVKPQQVSTTLFEMRSAGELENLEGGNFLLTLKATQSLDSRVTKFKRYMAINHLTYITIFVTALGILLTYIELRKK